MKKIIFSLIIVLLAGMVFAQAEVPPVEVFKEDSFLKEVQKSYNEQRGNAPEFFLNMFGNEKINIYMNGIDVHVVMVNGEMTEVGTGLLDDPTMNVYASKETVEKIMKEELGFKEALDSGLIKYEGVGFGSKVKFGAVKIIYKFYSWFS